MRLPLIFKRKFIAVLAIFVAIFFLLPDGQGLSSSAILCGLCWLIGAIFILRRQIWAVVLLTLMAIYQLVFDVIFEIPRLKTIVEEASKEAELAESVVQVLVSIAISTEAAIMLCVIYYGIVIILGNRDVE